MKVLRQLADFRRPGSPANRFRRRRFELFKRLLSGVPRPLRILDVGGSQVFWQTLGLADEPGVDIVVLNLHQQPTTLPRITSVGGDARAMPEFRDDEFDVVFSNSVIEHVGSWEDQQHMAAEVRRVGRRFFVQTPNRNFPIEPHFLTPGFQFLPVRARVALLRRVPLGNFPRISDPTEARRVVTQIRLLNRAEIGALFPGARLYAERVAGLTKSFIVYDGWQPRSGAVDTAPS